MITSPSPRKALCSSTDNLVRAAIVVLHKIKKSFAGAYAGITDKPSKVTPDGLTAKAGYTAAIIRPKGK